MKRLEDILPFVPGGAKIVARLDANTRAQLLSAMPSLKERAKTLLELLDGAGYLFAERPLGARRQGGEAARRGSPWPLG